MKKLLLVLICVFTTLMVLAQGKVYTEQLVVTINGESSAPQLTGVTVIDNGNQTINFELKNFFLSSAETMVPVGNILVENVPVTKGIDGLDHLFFDGNITIQPGDMEGVDMWIGPMFGEIPLKLQGKMNDEKLYVTIDIDMQATMGQVAYVQLGTDFEDNQDALDGIKFSNKPSFAIFDLYGRRVIKPSRGINVIAGKKVKF